MDFLVLSLLEATYLYLGLAIQALLRASSLRHLPAVLVLLWTLVLLWRAQGRPGGYKALVGYSGTCLVLLILFWPEAVPFGQLAGSHVAPSQVASYAATQDPGAEVVTAGDTNQVPDTLRNPALLAPGFRLVLRAMTETPLALARTINSQAHRTFASLMPMAWFLDVQLPADVTAAIGDWTQACYLPTLLEMLQGQNGRTIEDLLPFGNAPLRQQLAMHAVVPSSQTGMTWIRGPNAGNLTPCDVYLSALELQAQSWLSDLKSPKGTSYLELFETELGLVPQTQGAILLYREMLHAAGPGVPAPSLAAQYATLRGASVVGSVLEGAGVGATAGGLAGAGWGALAGLFRGGMGEFQRSLDGLSWLVKVAMVLVWYGPYLVGLINLVLIGLFPFVMLWAFIPGAQLEPLAHYFVAVLFTSSVPLWWALVDQGARLASQQPPAVDGTMGAAWSVFITAGMWNASLTALGILLMPVVTGLLYFAAFRAVGNLWRGGLL